MARKLNKELPNPALFHKENVPARIYESDPVQRERINKARRHVRAMIDTPTTPVLSAEFEIDKKRILEIGCGTADITGPFSEECVVSGVEINEEACRIAKERFPFMYLYNNDIAKDKTVVIKKFDVLVMCEILEHLESPHTIVETFMPGARYSLISHPLGEDLDSDISPEHVWSYDLDDFFGWFELGGHDIVMTEEFKMGKYNMIMGVGKNANP